jgi:hypothetical protein
MVKSPTEALKVCRVTDGRRMQPAERGRKGAQGSGRAGRSPFEQGRDEATVWSEIFHDEEAERTIAGVEARAGARDTRQGTHEGRPGRC